MGGIWQKSKVEMSKSSSYHQQLDPNTNLSSHLHFEIPNSKDGSTLSIIILGKLDISRVNSDNLHDPKITPMNPIHKCKKSRVSQKVPNCNCNKNEPHGPFRIISRRCGWLRQRQVADFCSTNMNQFLQFAPQYDGK